MDKGTRLIIHHTNPSLRDASLDFDLSDTEGALALAEDLRDTIIECRSIGISAPQLGINRRVIAVGDPHGRTTIIVAFNPVIVDALSPVVKYEEGCLSFPGLFLRIKRPSEIRVRYTTDRGVTDTIKLSGLTARAFLHEIDHLDGVLFVDRVGSLELHRAKRKQVQLLRRMKALAKSNTHA
jgi:peptide deformylase